MEQSQAQVVRRAAKAGSWYEGNGPKLNQELNSYLGAADKTLPASKLLKAVIGPHAGFAYSGPTAAWAYKNIEPSNYDRVVLLGPSHQLPFQQIGLTTCSQWATPFGNIEVDVESTQALLQAQGQKEDFILLQKRAEENEHSLEMHLPYIFKMFNDAGQNFKLLPMMVGQVQSKDFARYAAYLRELFLNERTLFVISSDFCHWGSNFDYTPTLASLKNKKPFEHITALDQAGMDLIAKHDLKGFEDYLDETGNTICGERPIRVLLALIDAVSASKNCETKFIQYNQSEQAQSMHDNSVSYASSYTTIDK